MSVQAQQQLWGGETTKAVANFPISGEGVPAPVIRWLGRIKAAAARVNADLGLLDPTLAERIRRRGGSRSPPANSTTNSRSTSSRLVAQDVFEHERQRGDRKPRRR